MSSCHESILLRKLTILDRYVDEVQDLLLIDTLGMIFVVLRWYDGKIMTKNQFYAASVKTPLGYSGPATPPKLSLSEVPSASMISRHFFIASRQVSYFIIASSAW